MDWYYSFYIFVTLLAAAILVSLSLYVWRHRATVPGHHYFFWMMFVAWGWMIFWALELIIPHGSIKILVNNIRYSFVVFVAYTIHIFLLYFTGWHTWIQPKRLVLIGFLPLVGVGLIWTNSLHHLVWQEYQYIPQGGFLVPIRRYGPWFQIQFVYNQLLTLMNIVLLFHAWMTQPTPYRKQVVLVLLGVLTLVLADVCWVFQLVEGVGLYPFALVVLGFSIAWALVHYQFLDIIPTAHYVIMKTVHDGIIVLDHLHRITAINPAALRFVRCEESAAIGKPLRAIVPSPYAHEIDQWCHQDTMGHYELAYHHAGKTSVYDAQVTPLQEHNGKPTGVVLVLRDITQRKAMEEALRESEERFRMLAENAHHVIFRLQLVPTRTFDYMSPAFTQLTGYDVADAYADPDIHFKIAHPESRPILMMISEMQEPTPTSVILRYIRKDGREIWVEQEQWGICDSDGRRIALEGVVRDITQRKQAEQQVIEKEKALTMMRERERLARELHDNLGQILSSLSILAQQARKNLQAQHIPQTTDKIDQILAISQSGFTDIREYILGVQAYSSIPIAPTEVSPQSLFVSSLETYLHQFTSLSGIKTSLHFLSHLPHSLVAPTGEIHMLRIIQEALTNVRKHARATDVHICFEMVNPREVPAIHLPIALQAIEQLWVAVTIHDNGQGFSPPERATNAQQPNGCGYGLASMQNRAEECGGHLFIESSPTSGTSIIVYLPIEKAPTNLEPLGRILLADDNVFFIQTMANLLQGQGFQVVGMAHNGEEAIEYALRLHPDIILMDIHMPQASGLEATRTIKQHLTTCHIVMLTISDDEEHIFDAIRYGASGYLLKNLDGDYLGQLLHMLLQGEVPLSPGIAQKILREFSRLHTIPSPTALANTSTPLSLDVLHTYEVELLTLVTKGYSYREVSQHMNFSERTIKRYMAEIIKKLHVQNRADAITYARHQGLVR